MLQHPTVLHRRLQGDVAFIELGYKLAAERCKQPDSGGKERHRRQRHRIAQSHSPSQQRRINGLGPADEDVFFFLYVAANAQCDRRGDERHRQDEGANQRENDRDRHGAKHLALNACKKKDRQVHRDDDRLPESGRFDHFDSRIAHLGQPLTEFKSPAKRTLSLGQPPQCVFDGDDNPVDNQPEVDRSQRHQVAADFALHHTGRRDEHRQGDGQRCDQRRADVAQQKKQNHDHQHGAFEEIALNGFDGRIDQ